MQATAARRGHRRVGNAVVLGNPVQDRPRVGPLGEDHRALDHRSAGGVRASQALYENTYRVCGHDSTLSLTGRALPLRRRIAQLASQERVGQEPGKRRTGLEPLTSSLGSSRRRVANDLQSLETGRGSTASTAPAPQIRRPERCGPARGRTLWRSERCIAIATARGASDPSRTSLRRDSCAVWPALRSLAVMDRPIERMLTTAQAASELGVQERAVRRYVARPVGVPGACRAGTTGSRRRR